MKKISFFTAFLVLSCNALFAQVSINNDNSLPNNSAMFDVKSTTKGMLIPRMTQTEIEAITSPANGLVVFCSTFDKFYVFLLSQNKWKEIAYGPTYINPGGGFYCGDLITINHLTSGGVAPVNKIITYGTVTNIPGEDSKCWITSNLGADHQAIAFSDPTEDAAGWYWQFNLKQGFKHDGTTRTPNTTWISSITESSDWILQNDPCALELGNGWRIPTVTEWTNVNAAWTSPWNSGLKLHAAGYLSYTDGSRGEFGSVGNQWSSSQSSINDGWDLGYGGIGNIYNYTKAFGFSLRCIHD
jgi:hypothetical protein